MNAHSDERGIGLLDNCAVRTSGALHAAGVNPPNYAIFGPGITIPSDVGGLTALVKGATTVNVPQGGTIPQDFISQFNPAKQCPANPATPCSSGK